MRETFFLTLIVSCFVLHVSGTDFSKELAEVKAGARTEVCAVWYGFNKDDSTAALQASFDSGAKCIVVGKSNGPWIISKTVKLPSNAEIIFEDGVELKAAQGAFSGITDMMLLATKRNNLVLRGNAIISMNKSDYQNPEKYKPSEGRHALALMKCSNIKIKGLTLKDSGGDGIYINNCRDITIDNVTCDNNHRQGISIISIENLLIKNSKFNNTSGAAPMDGIDFEPNHWYEKLVNCVIENCQFNNNSGIGIDFSLQKLNEYTHPISITVNNCEINDNTKGIFINNNKTLSVKGKIIFKNCNIANSKKNTFVSRGQSAEGFSVTIEDCIFNNSGSRKLSAIELKAGNIAGTLGNLHFKNVKVIDTEPDIKPFLFNGWKCNRLENLSGSIIASDGTEVKMVDILAKSHKEKTYEPRKISTSKLIPNSDSVDFKTTYQPIRVRFSGSFVQYAKKNQEINVNVEVFQIGRNTNPITVAVENPFGENIGKYKVKPNEKSLIQFTAESEGIYKFQYSSSHGIVFTSEMPGNGYITVDPIPAISVTNRMYFLVPSGCSEIVVRVDGGDNEKETVSAELIAPSGRPVQAVNNVSIPELLFHKRDNYDKDEIWSVSITKAVEDFNICILGDSVPVLSDSPDKVLKMDVIR